MSLYPLIWVGSIALSPLIWVLAVRFSPFLALDLSWACICSASSTQSLGITVLWIGFCACFCFQHGNLRHLLPAIILDGRIEQKAFKYAGITCFNPGSFPDEITFVARRPCTQEVEYSAL
ncbi:hypothetical protein QQP08_021334 [Theobroma cacao]|nr:hypothetical protein QQP08_021334 [Theobroma cacao]